MRNSELLAPSIAPSFLTVAQAAAYLGVSPNTLYVWRHRREGPPSFTMGSRRVVYRVAALNEWIEQQEMADSRSNVELSPLSCQPERKNRHGRASS
ncbi:helix-turn-helix domain-containing protein [Streptomyces sp. NPDC048560]|uniref:helix-turn-helix transcriptional regulator n=1 Tax=Streptomyces sp. NPDC048560 TaxID=3155488 RepID=UPI00341BB293